MQCYPRGAAYYREQEYLFGNEKVGKLQVWKTDKNKSKIQFKNRGTDSLHYENMEVNEL